MTDVVFFAGPVFLKPDFHKIDWYGRDVRIIPVTGAGSSYFSSLADQLRQPNGSILDGLLRTYGKGQRFDKIALAAFSAGHGLLNKVADVDQDRARLSAMCLHDATFNAFNTPAKSGYTKFAIDAVHGKRLLVVTTANTSDGTHVTGRDSWQLVWDAAQKATGSRPSYVTPRAPVPLASGGWWQLGSLAYWGNYAQPGAAANAGNDLTHGDHHDMAPKVWQGYLAPYWAGRLRSGIWSWAVAGAAVATSVGWWWIRR